MLHCHLDKSTQYVSVQTQTQVGWLKQGFIELVEDESWTVDGWMAGWLDAGRRRGEAGRWHGRSREQEEQKSIQALEEKHGTGK